MAKHKPTGELTLKKKTYKITYTELHLHTADRDCQRLSLAVRGKPQMGFAVWLVPIELDSIEDLHGQRMHFAWTMETYDDDTLSSNTEGVDEITGLNYLQVGGGEGDNYCYGSVEINFKHLGERVFECKARMRVLLADHDNDDMEEILDAAYSGSKRMDRAFPTLARATFTVQADDQDPFA